MILSLTLLLLHICFASANTEKVIFLGPSNLRVPIEHPTLEDLQLEALSPQTWSLRRHIRAEFPTNSSEYGHASWYLLHRLHEGQRYEVRICWAATQPTSFRLETYDLPTVFSTPELITSLAQYSETRQLKLDDSEPNIVHRSSPKHIQDEVSSTLFLQVFAAADYYTTDKTLMEHVPPVFVDIILDPYLFNVFPRSLLPTAAYIILLAIGGWHLAKYISKQILTISQLEWERKKRNKQE